MRRTTVIKLTLCLVLVLLGGTLYLRFPQVALADTIYVSGTISTDTVWTSDNLYVAQGDITVAEGISLTIEPGVIVKFQENTRLIVQGTFDARGTAVSPIVFTSINDDAHGGDTDGDGTATPPAKYDWGWIEFADSSDDAASFLEHCLILYGGKDNWSYSDRYYGAITLYEAAPTVANCTFQYNYINGIQIPGGTKSASAAQNTETWHNTDVVYVVTGDLTIAEGMKLIVNPNVTVKFQSNTRLIIQGALEARGTAAEIITFTSLNDDDHGGDTDDDGTTTSPNSNDWGWIEFADSSDDAASSLEHCLILYGGKDNWDYNDRYYGAVRLISASPTITNCTFSHNGNYAIGADTGSFPTVYGNTMTDNGFNGIGLYGGTISVDNAYWTTNDAVYVLDGDITIAAGKTLAITPGAIIKGKTNTRLIAEGTLDAQGTAANPIVFTSINDDVHGGDTDGDGTGTPPAKYDWGWIEFADSSDDAASSLEHCLILYGGKDNWSYSDRYYGAITLYDAAPAVANCTFQHNYINGIQIPGGTKSASAIQNTETWHNTDVVYVVTGDLTIAEGMKLVINPDVTVKLQPNARLIVQGALEAQGTAANLIYITSLKDDTVGGDTDSNGSAASPSPGDWRHIWFENPVAHSALQYVLVRYGGSGGYMVRSNSAHLTMQHVLVEYSSGDGLYIYHEDNDPDVTVQYCTFRLNNGSGVHVVGP